MKTAFCWNCGDEVEVAEGRCWKCCEPTGIPIRDNAALERLWREIQAAPTEGLQAVVDGLHREGYGDAA